MKQILAAYFQLKVSFLIHLLSKTNLFFSRFPFGISFQITFIKSTVTSEVTSVIQSIMNMQSEANNKVKVQNLKIFSENEVKTCSVQEEKEKEEDQC